MLGPEHPDYRDEPLKDNDRLNETELLYQWALGIIEKSLGPDDPNVAIRLNNLAKLLQDTDRTSEGLFRQALAIFPSPESISSASEKRGKWALAVSRPT